MLNGSGVVTGEALGFGVSTLGGASGGQSSWGRRMGRSVERCRVHVCGSGVRCGFGGAGSVILAQHWMAW